MSKFRKFKIILCLILIFAASMISSRASAGPTTADLPAKSATVGRQGVNSAMHTAVSGVTAGRQLAESRPIFASMMLKMRALLLWHPNCSYTSDEFFLSRQGAQQMHSIAWWPTVVVLVVATFTDLRSRRIPNWLVMPFMLAGIVCSVAMHGWNGLWISLAGLGLGAVLYGVLYMLGGMGMGDVKLVAAIGAWVGPSQLIFSVVMTGLVGGLMAVLWAVIGGFAGDLFSGAGDLMLGFKQNGMRPHPELILSNPKTRKMPYAPAIALGTLLSFFAH